MPKPNMSKNKYLVFLILLAAVFLSYGNTLSGQFIWDDKPLISENPMVREPYLWNRVFTTELYEKSEANYYRPLLTVSFIVNSLFSGLNTAGYHLVNILLHFCVGYFLYMFLIRTTGDNIVSLAASLFFLVHPVHSQTVSYISGRADSLAAIFLLLSLILYIGTDFGRCRAIFGLICFILALLVKEISVMLPVVLAGLAFQQGRKKMIYLKKVLPYFVIACLYGALRFGILNFSVNQNPFLAKKGFALLQVGLIERFFLFLKTLAIYLGSFLVPVHLHMERIVASENIFPAYWAGVIICSFFVFLALRGMRNADDRMRRAGLFFIFWFFAWLLPQSAFVFPEIMAEHFLYLPSVSLCFMLAFGIKTFKSRYLVRISFVVVFAYFTLLAAYNNRFWLDEMQFFKRTVDYSPFSVRARDSLAALYLQEGRYADAEREYKYILSLKGRFAGKQGIEVVEAAALYNLGILYEKTGRPVDALSSYNSAMAVNPKMDKAYNNAGLLYQKMGDVANSEIYLKRAIEINGRFYQAMNNLAQLYAQEGRILEAMGLWKQALVVYPGYEIAQKNMEIASGLVKKD